MPGVDDSATVEDLTDDPEPGLTDQSAGEEEPSEDLVAEADRLGFGGDDRKVWFAATRRQRGLIKARRHKTLKAQARAAGLDPERFLAMMPMEREEALNDGMERMEQRRKQILDKHTGASGGGGEDEESGPALRVHTEAGDVPNNDLEPRRREGVSVGAINERVDDLYGDRPPRTLADIYARWPLLGRAGGDDFYLRVERVQPKQYGGVAVAGYLGEIKGVVINEDQFGKFFGGREYHIQLYGPDPKGRCDSNGDLIIKALTDPVQVTVAHLAPNLRYLPSQKREQEKTGMAQQESFNPFGVAFPNAVPGMPTTSADASIFKSSLDFASQMIRDASAKPKEEGNGGLPPKHMMEWLSSTQRTQAEQAQRDVEARERILRDQVEQARKDSERREREVEAMKAELQRIKDSQGESGGKQITAFLASKDEDAKRIHENYRNEMNVMREAHNAHVAMMSERHNGELRRLEERIKDQETAHREALKNERDLRIEEERRAKNERDELEKRLHAEVARVREDERKDADRRVQELEKRADERIKDREHAQQRELNIERSNAEVKVSTEVAKMTYELNHLRERLAEKEKDLEDAKAEIEENKDPSSVLGKWEEQAKKLGFKKKGDGSDEPKTFWQTLGEQAGQGLGQALGNMDIGAVMGALSGAAKARAQAPRQMPPGQQRQQAPGLPPGQQQQAQQRAHGGQSQRAMRWATQGSPVAGPPVQEIPAAQAPPAPQQQPQQQAAPAAAPSAPAPEPAAAPEQQVAPAPQQPRQPPPLPQHRLLDTFGPEAAMGFIQSAEGAINQALQPEHFAQLFYAQYREPASILGTQFEPEEAHKFVELIAERYPDALGSPILTKGGQEWLQKMWSKLRELATAPAPGAPAAPASEPQA